MNFLKLVQEAARDAGAIAGLPSLTSVSGVSGRAAQLVGWVRDAWIDIQNQRQDWLWMKRRFTADLISGTNTYTAASLNLTRVADWDRGTWRYNRMMLYDPATGKSDEGPLTYIGYDVWLDRWDRGVHDQNRPSEWTVSPLNELLFGPTPDKTYTIRGGYRVTPQELVLDSDIPEMPEQFHRLIVVEAIALMDISDEVNEQAAAYRGQYSSMHNALVNRQTPPITTTGA